ncbi:Diaminopimelate decarboxylase [Clostridium acidisoli DSM 12555]|uniref:Diaminopimelate decarboxylase n=1 Tax=Clostridium acidisoli DSM 12555 TaxID=1121291 RepID=A0A1W1XMZ5_9CLOT|nr:alanine racemase [Clostridium acidisoli]SMC25360.1 Diaminopimelate decarboxylase [Clostridium acidisoli DSM 12555]
MDINDLNYIKNINNKLYINNTYYKDFIKNDNGPTLIIKRNRIADNCNFLKNMLKRATNKKAIICYALKVAPSIEILKIIKEHDIGVEVYCEKELDMAIKLDITPIVVDGFYKPKSFLVNAIENNVLLINADSFNELSFIDEICKNKNKIQEVGIRIKIDKTSKMGIDLDSFNNNIEKIKNLRNIRLVGIHTHPGSNIRNVDLPKEHYSKLVQAYDIIENNGYKLKYVDIGGGLPEKIVVEDSIEERLKDIFGKFRDDKEITFIVEPGRFLVSDSGILFSKIHDVRDDENIVILDIAVAPYFLTTNSNFKYIIPDNLEYKETRKWRICGIWPTDIDFIPYEKLNKKLPSKFNKGDYFCFLNAGAYVMDRIEEYTLGDRDIKYI